LAVQMYPMIKKLLSILVVVFLMCARLSAQDNVEVVFLPDGIPDKLNVCGDPDTIAVRIGLQNNSDTITSFEATWQLFEGISLTEILPNSSPGVVWNNAGLDQAPQFSLPDLGPDNQSIIVRAVIRANCALSDTLSQNNLLQVRNRWFFEYSLGSVNDVSETDASGSYRDAISIPFFTLDLSQAAEPNRVGDCFTREFTITNTSLDAYVDSIYYSNIQGAGARLDDLLVNGQSIPFTTSPAGPDQVVIEAWISGTGFSTKRTEWRRRTGR
jgi:hypothetical protein